MVAFIRPLLSVYTKDPLLITDTIPALYVIGVALILFSVSMIIFNGVSGSGNTKSSFRIEVVTILAYLLSTFIFSRILHADVQMVWCAEWVYMIVMGILSVIYLKTKDWKSTKI
jgi:Na+-driven multidrug efflux pump